jgi:hypothetical protein
VGVAVAVVVLVVVFVAGPALTGSGAVGPILPYSGARPVADRTVAGFEGGGWSLLFAAGLVSSTAVTIPESTTALSNLSCTFVPVSPHANLSVPAYAGNRSAGLAPAWEFGYGSLANGIALVSVIDGQGVVVGTLTGGECGAVSVLPSVPGTVIDSSRAAAAAEPYARAFLAANPNASAAFGLGPAAFFGGSSLSFEWVVLYSTCSANGPASQTGSEFNATVNALTGAVLTTHTASGVSCESGTFTAVRSNGPS